MGSIRIRNNGLWKGPVGAWVRDAGVWKQAKEIWFRYQGNWVQMLGPPGAIGSEYEGGYYIGEFSATQNGNATHYLVISPLANAIIINDLVLFSGLPSTSFGDGPTSSATLSGIGFSAAVQCENAFINGYSDWYLGAIKEYEIFYYNLKSNSTDNNTISGFGDNPYAVPSRAGGAYTTTVPGITSAPEFIFGGSQYRSFAGVLSSTSTGNNLYVCYIGGSSFFNGRQSNPMSVFGLWSVYPIRRVAI